MSTIKKAFISFAEDLAQELKSNTITFDQACERLKGFGYKVTDSGCWYYTYTIAGSRKGYYIHLWGTNMSDPGKPSKIRFDGIAWGDKCTEYDRVEV